MPITFASGLTAAAKDSKHRRTPSELQLRGGSLLCACGNLHQPCDCLLLLYATPCKSQASGKKFIFTSKYIFPDITKTALPKQSRKNASEIKSALGELRCTTCSLQTVLKFFDCCFSLIFRAFLPFRFSVVLFLNHKNRCFFNQKPSDVAHRLPPQKAPLVYCTSPLHRCP